MMKTPKGTGWSSIHRYKGGMDGPYQDKHCSDDAQKQLTSFEKNVEFFQARIGKDQFRRSIKS